MVSVFEKRASQIELKKIPGESPFQSRSKQIDQSESFPKSALRTLMQPLQGFLEGTTPAIAASFWQLLGMGEALDPESIDQIEEISKREGIPFDREKYLEAANTALKYIPTVGNISREIEERTGMPLEAKTQAQKALRLGSMATTAVPGTIIQKGVAGIGAPVASQALQGLGVPEFLADPIGLGLGGFAASKTPEIDIGKAQKPSGLTTRRFEKLEKPTEVSAKKIKQINEKVENEFRDIASDIIEKSPIEPTYSKLKDNPEFKKEAKESFKKVEELSETLPESFSTDIVKKEIVKQITKKKGTGFLPTEYEIAHKNLIKKFIKETPKQDIRAFDLVKQYRKNNQGLSEAYEPGKSFAYNRAKRDALLDYNRAIAEVIEQKFPDTEFSNLFKSTNKQWSEIMDAEAIDKFLDRLFDGKIRFEKGRQLFDKEGMTVPFKRALGEEGFKNFEQLTKDLLSQEKAMGLMKAAEKKGLRDLGETAFAFVIHPSVGKAKLAYNIGKTAIKNIYEALLDKPQLAIKWNKGLKEFKKGNFAQADKEFKEIKSEILGKESVKEIFDKYNIDDYVQAFKNSGLYPAEDLNKLFNQFKLQEVKNIEKETGIKFKDLLDEIYPENKMKSETIEVTPEVIKEEPKLLGAPPKEKPKKEFKEKAKKIVESKKAEKDKSPKSNRPDISKSGLKAQKKFIIDRVNDVIKNPSKYKGETVLFEVPGDGEFKIPNNEKALREFERNVKRFWPDTPLTEAKLKKLRAKN